MPEDIAHRGTGPLIYAKRLSFLASEFEIQTNSQALLEQVIYFAKQPEQEFPISHRRTIPFTWTGEEYRIGDGEDDDESELSRVLAIEKLYKRLHREALANLREHTRVLAAVGIHQEHSFLIVGPQRTGKSTLAVRLLLEGYEICGDELALLHDGKAVAFPRSFLLHGDSLALLPQLASITEVGEPGRPAVRQRLVAVDPLKLGERWRLAPLPVRSVFFLEPNYGARSMAVPCGKLEMTRRVIPQCTPRASGGNWIGDLCAIIDCAETFNLQLGELDSAVAAISSILRR